MKRVLLTMVAMTLAATLGAMSSAADEMMKQSEMKMEKGSMHEHGMEREMMNGSMHDKDMGKKKMTNGSMHDKDMGKKKMTNGSMRDKDMGKKKMMKKEKMHQNGMMKH